jgi:hypothetical protein
MKTVLRHSLCRLALTLFAALQLQAAEPGTLRAAIEDLSSEFGERYPNGPSYLERLSTLQEQLRSEVSSVKAAAQSALEQLERESLLANPLVSGQPLLFVVRQQYRPDHHNTATFFPAAQHEHNDGAFTPGSALKMIDLAAGGIVRSILDVPKGVVRDPEVHFDGQRIVFSMRRDASDSYHVYEINADGTGLRQLTFARDVDDLDPLYLPDEDIVFSSTREPKYCMCNRHIMANLFRMHSDGANIHQIGKSTLFEGHGSLMPDGRILYDRWEYVDRNFGDAQALWTVNPDGTGHVLYWGNNTAAPGAVIDARIVPGTELALSIFGSCHDRPWGALALLDRRLGMDGPGPVVRIWPADAAKLIRQSGWEAFDAFTSVKLKYEDPYPLGAKYFLASRMIGQGEQMGIFLIDMFGNELLVHTEAPGCFDPMPLGPRARPSIIPSRRDYANQPGYFYVEDVYQGTHMASVRRGAVKWLRVVESPEKRFWTRTAWNGQGQEAPAMNWHDFNNKRILGTVPVTPEGSAYFAVPSDRFVYFQLLDGEGMMIQSMRSGTLVQSGEKASCIGCHEDRRLAPSAAYEGSLERLRSRPRTPSTLDGWHGPARDFNYVAEVQPVFDRHCVRCHDFGTSAGQVLNLAGDRDLVFNVSYNELWRKKYLRVVGAGPPETQPAYAWGSHASKLVKTLREQPRCGGDLKPDDWDRIVTWIDLNAPYYPSYASAYPDNLAGRAPLTEAQLVRLEELTEVRLRGTAGHDSNQGPKISFDRPELSPCLGKFTDKSDPKYLEALALIRTGKELLARRPEADLPGFQPSALDQWREAKYTQRQQREQRNREALRTGVKLFESNLEPIP